MKIAILSFYSGLINRGAETWASQIKEKLGKKFEIEIISGRKGEFIFTNAISNFNRWKKSDIVVPVNGRIQTLICRIGTFFLGKQMVVFGHSGPGADDKFNLLCSPNVFVAFSSYQADWANKYKLPWTKIVVIPHAVDTNLFKPAKKKVRENIVLCVAANIPEKRVDLVRDAVHEIPNARLMAVGKGNEFEYPYSKMPEVYRQAKVFCFVPKTQEAFGLVYLEAMASNIPVVTIDDKTRREIVGNSGILVLHPENKNVLSSAIEEALRKNWKDVPRRQAEKFSWEKVVKMYEDLFENCLK